MARNSGPFPRKIFIPRRDWNELWLELRDRARRQEPGRPFKWVTNARVNALHIFSAETNDPAIIREVNRMADAEYLEEAKIRLGA